MGSCIRDLLPKSGSKGPCLGENNKIKNPFGLSYLVRNFVEICMKHWDNI